MFHNNFLCIQIRKVSYMEKKNLVLASAITDKHVVLESVICLMNESMPRFVKGFPKVVYAVPLK